MSVAAVSPALPPGRMVHSLRKGLAAIVVLAAVFGLAGCFGGSKKSDRQAAEPSRQVTLNLTGCSYLFHDSRRYQSISGTWHGKTIRWDTRPQSWGRWTPEQERARSDNGAVGVWGLLAPTQRPGMLVDCFKVWNLLPRQAWQKTVARNFKTASVAGWEANT
jgi:hypothetical protein